MTVPSEINAIEEVVDGEIVDETPALTIEQVEAMILEQFPPEPPAELFAGDENATWTYWTDMDTAERGVPDEWVWERLRNHRDKLLSECDWRVVVDAPWNREPWELYRQQLRDLPSITNDPKLAEWPEKPQ